MTPTPIILDCDPGHDDAIAILLALASPELELVGVTTVSGNQTLDKTTAQRAQAARACRPLRHPRLPRAPTGRSSAPQDVAAHVHGESGLDGPDLPRAERRERSDQHAVDYLAEELRRRDGKLTLVPTGPLTNIGLLCSLHPDARPERLVLMGGAIGEGNRTPAAEFNIWADPEAAQRVFVEGLDTTMVGLDVTHRALITDAHTERMRGAGNVGKVVAELMDFYARFHKARYPDLDGSPMHDPVCIAHVIDPTLDGRCATRSSTSTARPARAGAARTSTGAAASTSASRTPRSALDIDGARFAELVVDADQLVRMTAVIVFAAIAPHGGLVFDAAGGADAAGDGGARPALRSRAARRR